eukprot:g38175.t1
MDRLGQVREARRTGRAGNGGIFKLVKSILRPLAPKANYQVLFLHFMFGLTLTVEEVKNGHVTRGMGGGNKMDDNWKVRDGEVQEGEEGVRNGPCEFGGRVEGVGEVGELLELLVGEKWEKSKGAEQFTDFANNFNPALKFTWTISVTFLPFLDLSISISGNRLTTDIHFKPTDSHCYLNYTSSHPASFKNAIPYCQFLCFHHICSQDEAFYSKISQISSQHALGMMKRRRLTRMRYKK